MGIGNGVLVTIVWLSVISSIRDNFRFCDLTMNFGILRHYYFAIPVARWVMAISLFVFVFLFL